MDRLFPLGKALSFLQDKIPEAPEVFLGKEDARRFGGRLPFLFKVLAAGEPLSIQAHPSMDQAREGFAREEGAGLPLSARERSYQDASHKPELICALTPFWAMRGFRPLEDDFGGFLAWPMIMFSKHY